MIDRLDPYTLDSFACLVIVFDYLGMEIGIWYDNFALNRPSMFLFHKLGVFSESCLTDLEVFAIRSIDLAN